MALLTRVENISGGLFTLPAPYRGVIRPGDSVVIDDTEANVLVALGGTEAVKGYLRVGSIDAAAEPVGDVISPGGTEEAAQTAVFLAGADDVVPLATQAHSGTQSADLFDLRASDGSVLSGFTADGTLDMGGLTIENVDDPTTDQQAATKAYVDDAVGIGAAATLKFVVNGAVTGLANGVDVSGTPFLSGGPIPTDAGIDVTALTGPVTFTTAAADKTPLQAKEANLQTADVFEALDKNGAVTAAIPAGGGFDAKSHKVIGVATPTAATDAATKGYVDGAGDPILAGLIGQVASAATDYFYPGGVVALASATAIKVRIRAAKTFKGITVRASAAPGAGLTDTWTVQKNGVDTALTVSLADAATGASTAASVAFAAGDDMSIKEVSSLLSGTTDPLVMID